MTLPCPSIMPLSSLKLGPEQDNLLKLTASTVYQPTLMVPRLDFECLLYRDIFATRFLAARPLGPGNIMSFMQTGLEEESSVSGPK